MNEEISMSYIADNILVIRDEKNIPEQLKSSRHRMTNLVKTTGMSGELEWAKYVSLKRVSIRA